MKITKVTPLDPDPPSSSAIEVAPGDYSEVDDDWYQADVQALKDELDRVDLRYRERQLMRKAAGFEGGLFVGLLIWGGAEALKVLSAWIASRQGRRVRVKFPDGTEIEATSVKELEEVREKFLPSAPEEDDIKN